MSSERDSLISSQYAGESWISGLPSSSGRILSTPFLSILYEPSHVVVPSAVRTLNCIRADYCEGASGDCTTRRGWEPCQFETLISPPKAYAAPPASHRLTRHLVRTYQSLQRGDQHADHNRQEAGRFLVAPDDTVKPSSSRRIQQAIAAIMWLMVGPPHPTTCTTLRTACTEQSRYQEIAWNT
jgi:hypothetical protein